MYEGNPVDLRMEKIISADGIFDEGPRQCRVEKYDPEEDYIYLELKEDELTVISLDAKYRCYISTRTELLYLAFLRRLASINNVVYRLCRIVDIINNICSIRNSTCGFG